MWFGSEGLSRQYLWVFSMNAVQMEQQFHSWIGCKCCGEEEAEPGGEVIDLPIYPSCLSEE